MVHEEHKLSTEAAVLSVANVEAERHKTHKAAGAFRTISEVADELHVPQHVLRFWESKFPQVRPLKRGGGRRYYRPEDVFLLRRVADLLYTQGYTIKGVQRLLRDSAGSVSLPFAREEPSQQLVKEQIANRSSEELEQPASDLTGQAAQAMDNRPDSLTQSADGLVDQTTLATDDLTLATNAVDQTAQATNSPLDNLTQETSAFVDPATLVPDGLPDFAPSDSTLDSESALITQEQLLKSVPVADVNIDQNRDAKAIEVQYLRGLLAETLLALEDLRRVLG